MPGEPGVQSKVEALVSISGECKLVESIMRALTPDNRATTKNMSISESFRESRSGECVYEVEITVHAESDFEAVKRARATVNDLLLALKAILSTHSALKT